jgi:hypothetical protein
MAAQHHRGFSGLKPGGVLLVAAVLLSLAAIIAVGSWAAGRRGGLPLPNGGVSAQCAAEPPSVPPAVGYVGSRACVQCHREIAETYATHPMSRSVTRPGTDDRELRESLNTRVAGERRVYDIEFRDGVMTHHDRMFDAAGELIYDQAMPVDYVVGSGRRAKAYLHRRGELLFMSPLNWYSASRRWDLAPGYVPNDPRRFSRRITDDCLSCHAGRVNPVGKSLDRYGEPPFHEMAIGCENCHGPGERHVAWHSEGADMAGTDPIVNPARLDHDRRESVCYQCHLQAAARIPRSGHGDLDFRPGQALREVWTVLDRGSEVGGDGRTRSVNHVQQMRESRCYRESEGRLGCVSCHDPHRVPVEAERLAFYRERCLNCHDESSSCSLPLEDRRAKEDSCVACHMPARDTSNVSHVTQTDHRVLRRPDAAVGDGSDEESDGLVLFDEADRRLPGWEQDRALGLAAWIHLSRTDQPPPASLAQFLDRVLERAPNDGEVLTALGTMASVGSRTELARNYYERARRVPASEEAALSGLLDIYFATDRAKALACADRLIEIDPWDARTHALRAELLASLGRDADGIAAAERAIELDPTLVPVRRWLADAYRKAGRADQQREQEWIIERMQTARPPD